MDPTHGPLVDRLRRAPLELVGRFADASNATLLVRLLDRDDRDLEALAGELGRAPEVEDLDPRDLAVYKPRRGEQPLWDFPSGTLHHREAAAYEISRALGWGLVPCTVLRDDAPLGPGSLQRFVPHELDDHYFTLVDTDDTEVLEQLETMVVYDIVINNADRKGGHVLLERDGHHGRSTGRLQLIDHGVTFHEEPKLRTVGWHLAGAPLPDRLRPDLVRLGDALEEALADRLVPLLSEGELARLRERVAAVAAATQLPEPVGRWSTPWPLL